MRNQNRADGDRPAQLTLGGCGLRHQFKGVDEETRKPGTKKVGPGKMWHSGTLAAAKQAVLLARGVALSVPVTTGEPDFEALKPAVQEVLELILPAQEMRLLNVNFPEGQPKGLRWTRQSVRFYDGKVVPGEDPIGRKHFWFVVTPLEAAEEGTDRWAVEQGYVSITPLRLDLTNEAELADAFKRYPLES